MSGKFARDIEVIEAFRAAQKELEDASLVDGLTTRALSDLHDAVDYAEEDLILRAYDRWPYAISQCQKAEVLLKEEQKAVFEMVDLLYEWSAGCPECEGRGHLPMVYRKPWEEAPDCKACKGTGIAPDLLAATERVVSLLEKVKKETCDG